MKHSWPFVLLLAVMATACSERPSVTREQPPPLSSVLTTGSDVSAPAADAESAEKTGRTSTEHQGADAAATSAPSAQSPADTAVAKPLEVRRLVPARRITNREPADTNGFTATGDPVYAFIELTNEAEAEQTFVVTFEHTSGTVTGHVNLTVPARQRRWRTWALTRGIRKSGEWVAIVRSNGMELKRATFTVADAPGEAALPAPASSSNPA